VQVNQRLARLERRHAALADGLEHLRNGVVVVNRSGRVVFANRTARAIVSQRDGVAIAGDGLVPSAAADRRRLRTLLDEAVRTGAGEGFGAGGAMTIARPSLKRPFLVLVAPLPLALEGGEPSGLATVFISDPEAQTEPMPEMARRLYGLTPSETDLAAAFAATGSLSKAAEGLGISRETARWHLKHLYQKTGTHRQAALLKRLVDGLSELVPDAAPAAIAPGPHP
jgi:DNA-binding CsgD family transcriptional regulator